MRARFPVEERTEWRKWVTPAPLRNKAIHRWYVFPHSYTSELVHSLIDEWGLGARDRILDPFSGAGTTPLSARERGVPCTGYDLSPLGVLVSQVKTARYDLGRLEEIWKKLWKRIGGAKCNGLSREYPELVIKALPGKVLPTYELIAKEIKRMESKRTEQDFFRMALLATLPNYSRAVATGGWLKWVVKNTTARSLPRSFAGKVEIMLEDLRTVKLPKDTNCEIKLADARALPDIERKYTAIITSPPYPNRHDYTRVFGVELMFGFLDCEETKKLRYQSFHSHPEAHPMRPAVNGYEPSSRLLRTISRIKKHCNDPRVIAMLQGYFLDMFLCLREVARVSRPGARAAFVVGNAQYFGERVLVDELTAEIGERAGLKCESLMSVRYRGNSAQQMGRYGRRASRESVVLFSNPEQKAGK